MPKIKIPKGTTHYFQRPDGEVSYFLDSKTGTIFDPDGGRFITDDIWKRVGGVARLTGILTECKVVKVNTRLENK